MNKKNLLFFIFIIFFQIVKAQNEFITVWKPSQPSASSPAGIPYSSNEHQIWFPGVGTNYTIYWEEVGYPSHHATLQNVNSDYQILIDFNSPLNPTPSDATYRIKVSNGNGAFNQIQFSSSKLINGQNAGIVGDHYKILSVEQWGNIKWSSMQQAFHRCENLDITATDIPDLSEVTDMSHMFLNCFNLVGNPTINNWNISNVTTLQATFSSCYLFNQPIGNWNTSNVTSMASTFVLAQEFNQPLSNWNTSKVTNTSSMFFFASKFNQPIGNWDMSNNLQMQLMFVNATKFNQPIGNWNTSKVTDMHAMFQYAADFNQDIGAWNTSNVTLLRSMFFMTEHFNSNISNWNVSHVTDMSQMFSQSKKFNQNISGWNVSNVVNMVGMFSNAEAFNQNLGNWNLSSLQLAGNLLENTPMSCQNYNNTLYGWSQNQSLPSNINISPVSALSYSTPQAATARDYLINTKGWTINGDTYNPECVSHLGISEIKMKDKISIYPNPTTNYIYLKNTHADHYTIHDLSGRIVLKGVPTEEKIDIRVLTAGNYILQLHIKEGNQNVKFIKK